VTCPILVIEDDLDLREMMAQFLACEGFDVETARDGREALEILHRIPPPHAIVLDLMMPTMDGWQFRSRQREDPNLAAIPVIVVTAVPPPASMPGVVAVMPKPLDFDRFLWVLRENCRQPSTTSAR